MKMCMSICLTSVQCSFEGVWQKMFFTKNEVNKLSPFYTFCLFFSLFFLFNSREQI